MNIEELIDPDSQYDRNEVCKRISGQSLCGGGDFAVD